MCLAFAQKSTKYIYIYLNTYDDCFILYIEVSWKLWNKGPKFKIAPLVSYGKVCDRFPNGLSTTWWCDGANFLLDTICDTYDTMITFVRNTVHTLMFLSNKMLLNSSSSKLLPFYSQHHWVGVILHWWMVKQAAPNKQNQLLMQVKSAHKHSSNHWNNCKLP